MMSSRMVRTKKKPSYFLSTNVYISKKQTVSDDPSFLQERSTDHVHTRRRFLARRQTHFRNHLHELLQSKSPKSTLVSLQNLQNFWEKLSFAGQNQTAISLKPKLFLGSRQQTHENREVQEPGGDHEPLAFQANIHRQITRRYAPGLTGIGGPRRVGPEPEAHVLPPLHDLLEPYDLADLIYPFCRSRHESQVRGLLLEELERNWKCLREGGQVRWWHGRVLMNQNWI